MRFKEKRPNDTIKPDWFGEKAACPGKWVGVMQGPTIGVRYVRDRAGCVRLFDTEAKACSAAGEAFKVALDEGRVKRRPMQNPITRIFGRPKWSR
jgi:hypothetical protein